MSDYIYPDGSFDPIAEDMKTIGDTKPAVGNGSPAKALYFANADRLQTNLLYYGPTHASLSGAVTTETIVPGQKISVWVPAFCTRMAAGVIASGSDATVSIGSYVINVSSSGQAVIHWGDLENSVISVSGTTTGSPVHFSADFTKTGTVSVYAVIFKFFRHTAKIT